MLLNGVLVSARGKCSVIAWLCTRGVWTIMPATKFPLAVAEHLLVL